MKRALLITLFLSLAANAVFLVRATRPASAASATPSPVSPDTRSIRSEPKPAPVFSTSDWSALESASPTALTFLRQLGFTDPQIRAIARAEIDARYAKRERALRQLPAYWQSTFYSNARAATEPWKDPVAARALLLQKETELRQLLGDAYEPVDPRLRSYMSYLPFEKAWQLQSINDDYRRMSSDLRGNTQLRLPDSPERTRYLRQQERADLEALLSADELRKHDLYQSVTASTLRELSGFDATDQEFLALNTILRPLETLPDTWSDEETKLTVLSAKRSAERQIRDTLGEKRYADYQRAQDPAFRFNHELASHFGLSQKTALAGYETVKSFHKKPPPFPPEKTSPPTSSPNSAPHSFKTPKPPSRNSTAKRPSPPPAPPSPSRFSTPAPEPPILLILSKNSPFPSSLFLP